MNNESINKPPEFYINLFNQKSIVKMDIKIDSFLLGEVLSYLWGRHFFLQVTKQKKTQPMIKILKEELYPNNLDKIVMRIENHDIFIEYINNVC